MPFPTLPHWIIFLCSVSTSSLLPFQPSPCPQFLSVSLLHLCPVLAAPLTYCHQPLLSETAGHSYTAFPVLLHLGLPSLPPLTPPATPFPCIISTACLTAQVPYPIFPSKAFTVCCYSCISIEPIKANLFALISIYFSLVDIRFPFLLLQHDFLFVFLMVYYPPLPLLIWLASLWFQGLFLSASLSP